MSKERSPGAHSRAPLVREWIAPLLLVLATLFWSSNWVVGRALTSGEAMPPIALNFWRWTTATIILMPLALPQLRGKGRYLLREWKRIVPLAILGISTFQALVYSGLQQTTAINAVLMNSAIPVIIIALSWAVWGERITRWQALGIPVAFAGVLALLSRGNWQTLASLQFNTGDIFILLAMPVWGLYSILLARRPTEIGPFALMFVLSAVGIVFLFPVYLWEASTGATIPLTWQTVAGIAYVGLFASVLAFTFWNIGVARIGANRAGVFVYLMPAFGTILAVTFLNETIALFQIAGIAMILGGIWVSNRGRTPTARSAKHTD